MSFSSQILDKSVPEWKHDNIDYDKIKQVIKSHKNDKQLLVDTFSEQFEIVNIFLSLKIKEISTKILSIESSIIKFSQDQLESSDKNSPILKRKLKMIRTHASKCSKELEKLSRYIILQRVATKQLFQKIIKHFDSESSNEVIRDIKNLPMFKSGYENISFNNIDLDPYFWELSLIFDVINDLTSEFNAADSNTDITNKENNMNLEKGSSTDYLIKEASYRVKSLQQNGAPKFTGTNVTNTNHIASIVDYDRVFLGETENIQRFLISNEDIEEFKFMLLSNSFQLFDEEIISTSKDIVDTTTKGMVSISDNNGDELVTDANGSIKTRPSIKSMRSFKDITRFRSQSSFTIKPLKQIDFDDLTEGSHLQADSNDVKMKKEDCIRYQLLFTSKNNKKQFEYKDILKIDQINQFPDMIMTNKTNGQITTMCHIGGIRDHCITSNIGQNMLDEIFLTNDKANIITSHVDTPLGHIQKLILEWIRSHNLKPVDPTIDFKRIRFISYNQNNVYMLSISKDIVINEDLKLPYSIFELRCTQRKRNPKFLDKLYSNIISKKLSCYPLPTDLTIWKISLALYDIQGSSKEDIFTLVLKDLYKIDKDHRLTEEEFFNLGKSSLLELCSKDIQLEYENSITVKENTVNNIDTKLSKISKVKESNPKRKPVRYWNEFDDTEEYAESYNQTFYIDEEEDENSSLSDSQRDTGFIKFDKRFINDLYDTCQRIKNVLTFSKPKRHLLDNLRERYGSIASSTDDLERLIQLREDEINDSESTYEAKHDEMISLLYITTLSISTIITGITISIIITLFREESQSVKVSHETVLIVIIIFTLVLALLLITLSLLLLFSRFTLAPMWHYIISFVLFTVITISVCYGIIEIYF